MEGYGPSTYGDRFADVYDEWYPPDATTDATVDFLAALADGSVGVVYELGIGTGRLALPLADRGYDVRGIDASRAMVERLRAKPGGTAIPVTVGDMATADVPTRDGEAQPPPCAVVYCAANTFFGIEDAAARDACLRRIAERLAPDGALVLAAFVPPDAPEPTEDVTVRSMTADRVVLSVARRDPDERRIEGHYIELTEHGTRMRPYAIRYATPAELDAAATDAGLRLDARHADWSGTPFDPAGSPDHVSVYRSVTPRG